jgi:hypothetical protein
MKSKSVWRNTICFICKLQGHVDEIWHPNWRKDRCPKCGRVNTTREVGGNGIAQIVR